MFKKNRILRIRRSLRQARMASKIYVQTNPEAVWNCDYWISKIDLRVYFSTLHKSLTCPVFGLRSPYWNSKLKMIDLCKVDEILYPNFGNLGEHNKAVKIRLGETNVLEKSKE